MDYNIPPISDLIPPVEPSDGEPLDIAKMMDAVRNGETFLSKTEPHTFAARPGRRDAETLLKESYQRFTPSRTATENDIKGMVADIVAEQIHAMQKSPQTPARDERRIDPAGALTQPAAESEWDWAEEIEVIGEPQAIPDRPTPMKYAARSRAVDGEEAIDNLQKRATATTRRAGLLEWMRRELANGETVETLVKFARDNGQNAQAEQFAQLAKEL
jgi:hypothetical protein